MIWAPLSGMAAWGSTQTHGPWSVLLAVASGIFAVLLLWNLYMILVGGPLFMRIVKEVAETSVGQDKVGEPQGPRPLLWWYRRRGA